MWKVRQQQGQYHKADWGHDLPDFYWSMLGAGAAGQQGQGQQGQEREQGQSASAKGQGAP